MIVPLLIGGNGLNASARVLQSMRRAWGRQGGYGRVRCANSKVPQKAHALKNLFAFEHKNRKYIRR
jgi:hypothetical protein